MANIEVLTTLFAFREGTVPSASSTGNLF